MPLVSEREKEKRLLWLFLGTAQHACIAFLGSPLPFLGLLSSFLVYFPVSDFIQASLIKLLKKLEWLFFLADVKPVREKEERTRVATFPKGNSKISAFTIELVVLK